VLRSVKIHATQRAVADMFRENFHGTYTTTPFRSVKIHAMHVFQLIDAMHSVTDGISVKTSLATFRLGTQTGARQHWSLNGHDYTIGTLDVLQACDAGAYMGMAYSVIVQCADCVVFPLNVHACRRIKHVSATYSRPMSRPE